MISVKRGAAFPSTGNGGEQVASFYEYVVSNLVPASDRLDATRLAQTCTLLAGATAYMSALNSMSRS
jgi:flagellin-specific chaperone FliS